MKIIYLENEIHEAQQNRRILQLVEQKPVKNNESRCYVGYGAKKQIQNYKSYLFKKRQQKWPPKNVSRSDRTVKTSDWPKPKVQWDFFEKRREKSSPRNVSRS